MDLKDRNLHLKNPHRGQRAEAVAIILTAEQSALRLAFQGARPAPICAAAQTVMPDAVPVPQSGGEEPPIRSLIPVGLAALSAPDPVADS